ncbi:hypothetical protein Hanom_Chr03g00201101 [Helianthus anomalus]
MMKGPIYSRRVKKEEAAVPAVGVRQVSDQGGISSWSALSRTVYWYTWRPRI